MNKPLYVSGLCLWFVREIEKIDVVGLGRNQSSLPPGFVTDVLVVANESITCVVGANESSMRSHQSL